MKLFGIDIAKTVYGAVKAAGNVQLYTLVRVMPGQRDAADSTGGNSPSEQRVQFRGIFDSYTGSFYRGTVIARGERTILALGASFPSESIFPEEGDKILGENGTWKITAILERDPAKATYLCLVKSGN